MMVYAHLVIAYSYAPKFNKLIPGTMQCMAKVSRSGTSIRPTLDDIERISKGQAAIRRGTGKDFANRFLDSLATIHVKML